MYLEMADNCEELERLKTQLRFAQKRIEELEATGIVILLDNINDIKIITS